jgi:CBS domain-containing protein
MKVKDVMSTRSLLSVRERDEVGLAAQMLVWAGFRHLPVVRGRQVVGVVSERDLVKPGTGVHTPVSAVMRSPAITAGPDDDIGEVSKRMADEGIGCMPVVDDGDLVGMITTTDLVVSEVAQILDDESQPAPTVLSAMTRNPITVAADAPLVEAVALMSARGVRHMPVVDGEGRLHGMLSDRDVRTAIGSPIRALDERHARARVQSLRVSAVMSRPAYFISESASLGEAATRFVDHRIGALPVVSADGQVVGILSYADVIRELLRHPVRVETDTGTTVADAPLRPPGG